MGRKFVLRCAGVSVVCTIIFFVSYYGGLFYKIVPFAAAAVLLNTALLSGVGFNSWGIKFGVHAITVLAFSGAAEYLNAYRFVGKLLGIDIGGRMWGESLMINNCYWFGILFCSSLLSLAVTAVIVYVRKKEDD